MAEILLHENILNTHRVTRWVGSTANRLANNAPNGNFTTYGISDVDKIWRDTNTDLCWLLISVSEGIATWKSLGGGTSSYTELSNIPGNITEIAAITLSENDIIQRKAGVLVNRSISQLKVDLALTDVDNIADVNKVVSAAQALADAAILTAANAYSDALANTVTSAFVMQGTWDIATGHFPDTVGIKNGWTYVIANSATISGIDFSEDSLLIAIIDSPSSSTYHGNWYVNTSGLITGTEMVINKSTNIMADATDNTKYPSCKSVVDYIAGIGTWFNSIIVSRSIKGTNPILVAEFNLTAGTYTHFSGVIGSSTVGMTAILELKLEDGTVVATIINASLPTNIVGPSFTLAVTSLVGVYLRGDTALTESYVFTINITQ